MRDLLTTFRTVFDGGVLRLFNLFNLKNSASADAMRQHREYIENPYMFSKLSEIDYRSQPVVIATGKNAFEHSRLTKELRKYISLADGCPIYSLSRIGEKEYGFQRAIPDNKGVIESFHPSYTFKYGNTTTFDGFGIE